jgi:hypothetical protein
MRALRVFVLLAFVAVAAALVVYVALPSSSERAQHVVPTTTSVARANTAAGFRPNLLPCMLVDPGIVKPTGTLVGCGRD